MRGRGDPYNFIVEHPAQRTMSRVETAVYENLVDFIAVIYSVGTFHAYRVPVIKLIKTTSTVKLQRSENASCSMGSGKAFFLLSDAHWWP